MTTTPVGCPYIRDVLSSMDVLALSTPSVEGTITRGMPHPRRGLDVEPSAAGPSRPRPSQDIRKRRARAMTTLDRTRPKKKRRTCDADHHQTHQSSHQHQHQHQHHRPSTVPRRGTGPAESVARATRDIHRTQLDRAADQEDNDDGDEMDEGVSHGDRSDDEQYKEGEDQYRCDERIQCRVTRPQDDTSELSTTDRFRRRDWQSPIWRRRAASAGRSLTGWPRCSSVSWRRPAVTHSQDLQAAPVDIIPPVVTLHLGFSQTDGLTDVPAAFYAGTGIPTLLRLVIDRNSTIAHELRPQLHMTLTGTLRLARGERQIIQVSVSLADGLAIWSRDAITAHRVCPFRSMPGQLDPERGLPGGRYNLPLTVQVPDTRLPPSFEAPDGRFAISYRLTATLSIDNPKKREERMVLGMANAPFTLLPTTLPDQPLTLQRVSSLTWHRCGLQWNGETLTDCVDVREKWAFEPTLPCTTFSPTQVVPVDLLLTPIRVESAKARMFIRIGIKRCQHVTDTDPSDLSSPINELQESIVSARIGVFEISGQEPTRISGTCLPLAADGIWPYGYSAYSGEVSQPGPLRSVTAGNQFYAFVQIGRLPDSGPLADSLPIDLPLNTLLPLDAARYRDLNRHATQLSHCTLPITIGSVSEPQGAMHFFPWSDLSLSHGPRLIEGGSFSSENGWLVPPPPYIAQADPDAQPDRLVITTLAGTIEQNSKCDTAEELDQDHV